MSCALIYCITAFIVFVSFKLFGFNFIQKVGSVITALLSSDRRLAETARTINVITKGRKQIILSKLAAVKMCTFVHFNNSV